MTSPSVLSEIKIIQQELPGFSLDSIIQALRLNNNDIVNTLLFLTLPNESARSGSTLPNESERSGLIREELMLKVNNSFWPMF